MGAEDELRRCARAGAALAGAMANLVHEAAEQLMSAREQARRDALRRAENLARQGRCAAADVLATLRRDLSAVLSEMEHLERSLRAESEAVGHNGAGGNKGPAGDKATDGDRGH
ncbi:MAG: hypothetical protein ACP5VR_11760 [Acidimicrobiales bacterium]